ncbi:MAG: HDOD domain-containing protein [Nitrospirales bacterium]|nr:HDOD domain-containing protein [Nitrospira sp.]MDR4501749.1 HDOD domain-containing protein [Nitrospirales bacterium]
MTPPASVTTDQEILAELRQEICDQLEGGTLDLPLLPQVANQVLLVADDPNADPSKLSSLIQQDQALAGQILRIANSPAYLPRSPIASLQQAIAWLGLNMLSGIAFSVSVQSGVFNVKGFEKEIKGLWRHALMTGLYGKEIARKIRHNVENAFLCGLLHGIGKPVVLHIVLGISKPRNLHPTWPMIEQLMDESYVPIGSQLAESWKLPEPVRETIRLHQEQAYTQSTSPTKGAIITCLASTMASFHLDPMSIDEDALRTLPVVQDLNFYPEDMDALLELHDSIDSSVECMIL